jgi:hypothetical protein
VPLELKRREQVAVMEWTRSVANRIGLRDWTLHFDWDHDAGHDLPEGHYAEGCEGASIQTIYGRRHAVLRLGDGFREYAPDKQRQYLVHELVHCHVNRLLDFVDTDLKGILGRPTWDLLSAAFERELEYAVDALADVLAPQQPLIPWPD